ncbi:hypothetical protein EVG20_g8513 [Dentipellis fragilis]|uniref:SnoaL-like domain-containing protein n=1 Tax=Dentipellis fragilis TaxID=205917 RepID=A0A4Y9Y4V8_9AGAM|nr:hypothetical protein EVG20_g8513 [Dentipellis fragilis]
MKSPIQPIHTPPQSVTAPSTQILIPHTMNTNLLPPDDSSPQRQAVLAWLQALDAQDAGRAEALLGPRFEHATLSHAETKTAGKEEYMGRVRGHVDGTARRETRIQDMCEGIDKEKVWVHTISDATTNKGDEERREAVWMFRVEVSNRGEAKIASIKELPLQGKA